MNPTIIIISVFIIAYYLTSLHTALFLSTFVALIACMNKPSTNVFERLSTRLSEAVKKPSHKSHWVYVDDVADAYVEERSFTYNDAIKWLDDLYFNKLDDTALILVSMIHRNTPDNFQKNKMWGDALIQVTFRDAVMRKILEKFETSPESWKKRKRLTPLEIFDFKNFSSDFPLGWDSVINDQNAVNIFMLAYKHEYERLNEMTGLIDLFDNFLKKQTDDIKANRDGMLKLFAFRFAVWLWQTRQIVLENNVPNPNDEYTYNPFAKKHSATVVKNLAGGNLPTDIQEAIFRRLQL